MSADPVNVTEFNLARILPIHSIRPSPKNNKVYNPGDVTALAEDIKKRGQIDPIVITIDRYILSGHRRHEACLRAGLTEVKCRFHDIYHDDPGFVPLLIAFNEQRIKTIDELLREGVVKANPKESHRALIEYRRAQLSDTDDGDGLIELRDYKGRAEISKAKYPLLRAVQKIIEDRKDYWPLSVRQIHYALLNDPPLKHASKPQSVYRNDKKSYDNALVDITTRGRLTGVIPWAAIDDETRPMVEGWGYPSVEPFIKKELDEFLKGYYRNYQRSQPAHIEIIGEKNTIQTIVRRVASEFCIPYTIGRGYCSLSPRKKMADRFRWSGKDQLTLLALSDFDPDGEEIAHSFARSLRDDFLIENIRPIKVALTKDQVEELELPPILKAKESSSNYDRFADQHGDDVYELEAIEPEALEQILRHAIDAVIDTNIFNEEIDLEEREAAHLDNIRQQAHRYFSSLTLTPPEMN
jgi:hypothetical protein